MRGLVGAAHGELIHVELAEHHGAFIPQVLGNGGFVCRGELTQDGATRRGSHAFGAVEVFNAEGRAVELTGLAFRAAFVRRVGHIQRLVMGGDDVGVQLF